MSEKVTVVGTVATEPKEFITQSGLYLCSFRLACTEKRFDENSKSWNDTHTNWFQINVSRALGRNSKASISKGDRVFVAGKLRIKDWENGGRSGRSVEIYADQIGHDLRWGTTKYMKNMGEALEQEQTAAEKQQKPSEENDAWLSDSEATEAEQIKIPEPTPF